MKSTHFSTLPTQCSNYPCTNTTCASCDNRNFATQRHCFQDERFSYDVWLETSSPDSLAGSSSCSSEDYIYDRTVGSPALRLVHLTGVLAVTHMSYASVGPSAPLRPASIRVADLHALLVFDQCLQLIRSSIFGNQQCRSVLVTGSEIPRVWVLNRLLATRGMQRAQFYHVFVQNPHV